MFAARSCTISIFFNKSHLFKENKLNFWSNDIIGLNILHVTVKSLLGGKVMLCNRCCGQELRDIL